MRLLTCLSAVTMASYLPSGDGSGLNITAEGRSDSIADPCDIAIDLCESNSLASSALDHVILGMDEVDCRYSSSSEVVYSGSEEIFAHHASPIGDKCLHKFNLAIGVLEDILVSDQFAELQNQFFDRFYACFDYGEENKLNYMDIFQLYQSSIEGHIERELQSQIPDFSMEWMSKMLSSHQDCVDMGVMEILHSFSDFLTFKDLMLRYKDEKEGRALDLSDLIMTSSFNFN